MGFRKCTRHARSIVTKYESFVSCRRDLPRPQCLIWAWQCLDAQSILVVRLWLEYPYTKTYRVNDCKRLLWMWRPRSDQAPASNKMCLVDHLVVLTWAASMIDGYTGFVESSLVGRSTVNAQCPESRSDNPLVIAQFWMFDYDLDILSWEDALGMWFPGSQVSTSIDRSQVGAIASNKLRKIPSLQKEFMHRWTRVSLFILSSYRIWSLRKGSGIADEEEHHVLNGPGCDWVSKL